VFYVLCHVFFVFLGKCGHCTITFRWFQCLGFMSTFNIPHVPLPTRTCFIVHSTAYHIPFSHNNGAVEKSRERVQRVAVAEPTHISVIYIDKVNGMECVCACWLDFNSDSRHSTWTRIPAENKVGMIWEYVGMYVGMYVQKFAFLASVTRQTEVVYKELHLKATQKCYHSCPETRDQKPESGVWTLVSYMHTCNFYGL